MAIVSAVLLSIGCVGGNKGLSSEDKEKLKAYVLEAPPADLPHKLDVNFENKAHLIGYKFEPEMARPGQDVKLTYYWRSDDTLEDGWLLFTHTKDEGSGKMGNLDFVGPIREERNGRQVLGPERWEKGKVYVDEQTYKVPAEVTGSEVTVFVGIWKGDARLRIISGPNDGDNSAIVGKIKTGIEPKAADEHTANDVPSLVVRKLADGTKITIDGKPYTVAGVLDRKDDRLLVVAGPCSVRHSERRGGKFILGLELSQSMTEKAVAAIVETRTGGGPFKNIFDFCERIDHRIVSRAAIEKPIKAGVFDCWGARRCQLMLVLPKALQGAGELQQDRRHGQRNFFDALGGLAASPVAPAPGELGALTQPRSPLDSLPDVPEWPDSEKLKYEKEALDFYITSHPLTEHQATLDRYTTRLSDIPAVILAGGLGTRLRAAVADVLNKGWLIHQFKDERRVVRCELTQG